MDADKKVVAIEVEGEADPGHPPFLTLVRLRYRNRYSDGTASRPYHYEYINRRGYDAVAVAIYHEEGGEPFMAYRPGIRVPAYFRKDLPLTLPDARENLFTPEAVAGSLEPEDQGLSGFLKRVVEEVSEEAGFSVEAGQVEPLGGGFFPSHGQSSEKIHLCAVRVRPSSQAEARGDGSVNESDASPVLFRPVREILSDCSRGAIEDPKIEVLAWRLCIRLGYSPFAGRYAVDEAGTGELRMALGEAGFSKGRE